MTDEENKMVNDWLTKIDYNRGYMNSNYYDEWEDIHTAYLGNQELKENHPNSRVNILHANIEGQVGALVEQNLAITCRGEGPTDQGFADWGRIGIDWSLRQNKIKSVLARHERRRELFGPAWLKLNFDADAVDGYGLAKITSPPLDRVFVDLKVNDPANLQEADYIAEIIPKSKTWAKEEYGDKADNIYYGDSDRSPLFQKDRTLDDEDAFWLIQLWTMTDGTLRKIEFSDDGVLLYDSFEDKEIGKKPYYKYNKYPYFLTIMYPEEGKLYGFGDGKLLKPLQDMLNDLYDQIRRAARPNRIFFDPESEVELEDMDEDDGPIPCRNPGQNIREVQMGNVNPALWQLLNSIHQEVQRVTRFSELMMGQNSKDKTATEAAIQQQQGNSATDHKKLMLQQTLEEVCKYMLSLMMEHYTEGKFFRLDEDKEDYMWVDFRQMNAVPVVKPPTEAFIKDFRQSNPDAEMPKWQQLDDGSTKSVDLDVEINIGAGLPKNKAFLYQMMEKLSGLIVEGRNVLSWQETRDFIEDFLGIPLEDQPQIMPGQMPGQMPIAPGQMPSPDTQGLGMTGAPIPPGGMM